MQNQLRVGLVGCGNISSVYLKGALEMSHFRIVACADLDLERARRTAEDAGLKATSVPQLLADPEIDLILNLTIPKAHAEVAEAALIAGKHVYSEKPIAVSTEEAYTLLKCAKEQDRRLGCAPDTFLSPSILTAGRALKEGEIGKPYAAISFWGNHGPDRWHPRPESFYEKGAGPLFDTGPYPLSHIVQLFGPVAEVLALTSTRARERIIGHESRRGDRFFAEEPTHVTAILETASGVEVNLTISFDIWAHHVPLLEIYGESGAMRIPSFAVNDQPVEVWKAETGSWSSLPLSNDRPWVRGTGLDEFCRAILSDKPSSFDAPAPTHLLDVMETILRSGKEGRRLPVRSF